MIINRSVWNSFHRTDRKWFAKVLELSGQTRDYVEHMKKSAEKKLPLFECHAICRAIALHIPELLAVDGYYVGISSHKKVELRHCSHTWLVTPSGAIIDPYPVGLLSCNPILVVSRGKFKHFGKDLYWPCKNVTNEICDKALYARVEILSRIISEAKHQKNDQKQ